MAVGAGGGFGARLAALFAGEGPALVVRDGALRAARAFTAAQAHERVESGTRIAIAAGASIGAGTRIELLGGAVSIGAGARIGEGVVLRPSGSISAPKSEQTVGQSGPVGFPSHRYPTLGRKSSSGIALLSGNPRPVTRPRK